MTASTQSTGATRQPDPLLPALLDFGIAGHARHAAHGGRNWPGRFASALSLARKSLVGGPSGHAASVRLTTSLIPYDGGAIEITSLPRAHAHCGATPAAKAIISRGAKVGCPALRGIHGCAAGTLESAVENLAHARGKLPIPSALRSGPATARLLRSCWNTPIASGALVARPIPCSKSFCARFIGKSSPVHFFWGSFDLAVYALSGRRAPERVPAPMATTREAYSHEVISGGFWPGTGDIDATFYAYAAPQPDGFSKSAVSPAAAGYNSTLSEFLLPYEAVRKSTSRRNTLSLLQSTYDRRRHAGKFWDWKSLER